MLFDDEKSQKEKESDKILEDEKKLDN